MISLPTGCKYSIRIYPSNWKLKAADLSLKWYVECHFVDPAYKKEYPVGIYNRIKAGINEPKTHVGRRNIIENLLAQLKNLFEVELANPILGKKTIPEPPVVVPEAVVEVAPEVIPLPKLPEMPLLLVSPSTPFLEALEFARTKSRNNAQTVSEMRGMIAKLKTAAIHYNIEHLPIYDIQIVHVSNLLDHILDVQENNWTAKTFNKNKANLSGLFNYLVQKGATPGNPARGVLNLKESDVHRELLTEDQVALIKKHLYDYNRPFYKFMIMFYYSGGRESELSFIKCKDVDLVHQTYKSVVLKGTSRREVKRTIAIEALPYWKEQLAGSSPNDYVFSNGQVPGPTYVSPEQMGNLWLKNVKIPLGITANFYSLKHLHSGRLVEQLGAELAAFQNAHTSTQMVREIYAKDVTTRINHNILKNHRSEF